MKKRTVKLIKKSAREEIPISSMRGKVIPSKKRRLIEKALKKNQVQEHVEDN
ncbi:MAG: hypothetical protein AB1442_12795 [Nitrospirota bacterium]